MAAETGAVPGERLQVSIETGGVEVIDHMAGAWRQLCDENSAGEPFCRPEFVAAFVRAFAPKALLTVVTASIDGKLRAVLPLLSRTVWSYGLPARQLEGVSGVHSCRFDLVKAPGAEGDAALEAIWSALKDRPGWDVIRISSVPEKGLANQLVELATAEGYAVSTRQCSQYPYIPLVGDGNEPWLREVDGHFRRQVQRRTRQLEQLGSLRLLRIEKADSTRLGQFYELESSGWKGKEGTAIGCHAETRQFYDEIAREAERFGYFGLYQLSLDDHLLAASFGFEYRGRCYPLKWCYDEDRRSSSPGHVLIQRILRDCKSRGLVEFDFAGPSEDYKLKWTRHLRPNYDYCIYRDSFYGRVLHGVRYRIWYPVKRQLKRVLKRRTETPPPPASAE